jgi:GGDEF domain-containing protein
VAAAGAWQASNPEEERPLSWDESPPVPPALAPDEIAIRDERAEEGPGAWMRSIGLQLHRFQEGGEPFAVLLAEAFDERAEPEGGEGTSARLNHQVEERLATELRRWSGTLTRERADRYWLVIPDSDAAAAEKLAEGLARAVDASMAHRGLALRLAVGTAVCPEDGRDAVTLAAHADVALCAVRRSMRAQARAVSPLQEPSWGSGR